MCVISKIDKAIKAQVVDSRVAKRLNDGMGGQAIPNKPDEVGNACVCKGLQKGNIVGRVCFGRRNKLNEKEH